MRHARADVVAFERAVIQLPEVVYSHHVTGNYDYLLQVEVADLPAYEDFHANRLASLPGVAAGDQLRHHEDTLRRHRVIATPGVPAPAAPAAPRTSPGSPP